MLLSQKGGRLTTAAVRDLFGKAPYRRIDGVVHRLEWRGLCRDAGIPKFKAHPHILRSSRASHMLQDGAGVDRVQLLLGHVNVSTTQAYLHLGSEYMDDAVLAAWLPR